MTTTTMHFGPEWMRPKHPLRPQNPPSPPPNPHAPSGASSYSALLTPSLNTQEPSDSANPFLYSKEDLLKIYKDGGGRGGLGLEVERWEGVVREVGSEPVSLKEWTEGERKLFTSSSINSEVRRRQSTDYLSPHAMQSGERPKHSHTGPGGAPLRERFGGMMRKRDGTALLVLPQGPHGSPRDSGLPSPRTRGPLAPGFDGILNSGETWVSRRRASESGTRLSSGVHPRVDDDDELQSASRLRIDEQEEDQHRHSESIDTPDPLGENPSVVDNSPSMNGTERPSSPTFHNPTHSVPTESIPVQPLTNPTPVTATSQTVTNPATIEWTYLDPQGSVQGPFQAELMQKWYEEGYFAIDLLMRRVNLDEIWTPVGELAQRAGGERVFFFNFDTPAVPPGLSRRREPSRDPVGSPFHLGLVLRLLVSCSNSPSSSFGTGRFGDNSPDPASFGGLVVSPISSTDPPIGPRSGNVIDPAFVGVRRTGYADAHFEQGFNVRTGLPNTGSVRASSMDSYSFNSSISPQPPWTSSNSVHPAPLSIRTNSYDHKGPSPFTSHPSAGLDPAYPGDSSLSRGLTVQQEPLGQSYGNVVQRDLPRLGPRDLYQLEQRTGLGLGGFDGTPSVSPFDSPVQHPPYPQPPSMNLAPQQASNASIPSTLSLSQTTWNDTTDSAPKRTGLSPFDTTPYPTSRNTTSTRTAPPPPAQSWAPMKQPTPSESSQSPWFSAAQGIIDEGWGHVPGPHSLTVSNLTQHTQQQDAGALDSPLEPTSLQDALPQPVQSSSIPVPPEPPQQLARPGRKFSVQTNSAQPNAPTSSTPAANQLAKEPTPLLSAVSAPTKPVWSTEDDKKKSIGSPTSLREIQEMEAKKQEARKAAERERTRAAAAPVSEESQTFTASWGLPTSQVVAKTSAKDPPGVIVPSASASTPASVTLSSPTHSSTPPVAVWTNTQKPATKKSMRDILDEEEKRKKAAFKEPIAAIASRRAYAETTSKVGSLPVGGAWTTVGANGKTTAAAVAASPAGRPTLTPSTSIGSVSSPRGTATTAVVRMPVPPAKGPSAAPKPDDTPVAPSPDFMKWLNDSLKQLNSSVNCLFPSLLPYQRNSLIGIWGLDEEIASMLLSFPLDGDATTAEIISELIYDNSTTLDGRRFAQDFISRRRADVASKKPSGRAPSIADVVKAQPKPSQQTEWGGFKVVKQKKKGGRS
ncbi:hypothetical protein BJV77DRAFT_994542 [Russula vinacea]|nr:hypothetical protein BJV77DRAFT_994542 [Russula vinacea]